MYIYNTFSNFPAAKVLLFFDMAKLLQEKSLLFVETIVFLWLLLTICALFYSLTPLACDVCQIVVTRG